jgi:ABC-2 type transport system permease protein
MIRTIFLVQWLQLRRDTVALIMTFALPIVFFSVYALMVGDVGSSPDDEVVEVIVLDEDDSAFSRGFIGQLERLPNIRVVMNRTDRANLEDQMASESIAVGLIIPGGLGASWQSLTPRDYPMVVVYDPSNPYDRYQVIANVQSLALALLPQLIDRHASTSAGSQPLSAEMQLLVTDINRLLCPDEGCNALIESDGILQVSSSPMTGNSDGDIAYYAAGVGVMFLLFSMAGAGGSLLSEQESGTLERLLNSQLSMGQYIIGCWLFFTCTGTAQLAVMFAWAGTVFTLPPADVAFIVTMTVMTLATAMAAAAFGMVLASLSRSRAQLAGMSTIVILVMSALGGSMFPRFLMSPIMETVSLFTFNGWAIDGYTRIFWQAGSGAALWDQIPLLLPNIAMLVGMALVFLGVARRMVVRWEHN